MSGTSPTGRCTEPKPNSNIMLSFTLQAARAHIRLTTRKSSLFIKVLFCLFPDATFDYGPDPQETWDEFYFTVEGSRTAEWLSTWLTEPYRVRQTGLDDAQQSKIDRIFMLMESGIPSNLDRASLLLESLLYEFVQSSQPNTDSTDYITKLMDDIAASLHQSFDADAFCERYHISISTLRRIIQKHTGYSLNKYIHRLKISEAKNILLNTDRSIKDTAVSLGYNDVFYFSRLFKKYVGVSPTFSQ